MFDVNRQVDEWRRALAKAGLADAGELDELESHLLQAYETFVRSGLGEQEAFSLAMKQVGDPSALAGEYAKNERFGTRNLWRAFRVAPVVAPVLFAIDTLVLGLLLTDSRNAGTPIGLLWIPLAALTLGVVLSYAVAAALWMPLMLFLWKRGWLHGATIHAAAFLLAVLLCVLLEVATYLVTTPRPTDMREFLASGPIVAGFVIPHIMLSACVFWWMVRESPDRQDPLDAL